MPRSRLTDAQRRSGRRLGTLLRVRRELRGQTAEALSHSTSCSIETIRSIEQGKISNPGLFTVYSIATALDLNLDAVAKEALEDG